MYSTQSDNLSGRVYAELGDLKNTFLQGLKFSVNYGFDLINSAGATYYNPYNGNSVAVKVLYKSYCTYIQLYFQSIVDIR